MTRFEQEQLYQTLARAYVRADGTALLAERAGLPAAGPTPNLDARVARIARTARRRGVVRWLPGVAVVAAGLLLAVFLGNPDSLRLPSTSYAPSAPAGLPAPPGESPVYTVGRALIPLTFALPDNLRVAAADTDRGQTIYHLEDTLRDDVVLTLEHSEADMEGLQAVTLGNATVYGAAGEGYNLLTFERDGVVYSMTCRYDMRTLVALAEAILL